MATMTVTKLGAISGKFTAGGVQLHLQRRRVCRRQRSDRWLRDYRECRSRQHAYALDPDRHAGRGRCWPRLPGSGEWLVDDPGEDYAPRQMYRNIWKDTGVPCAGYYTAVLPGGDEYGSGYLAFTVDTAETSIPPENWRTARGCRSAAHWSRTNSGGCGHCFTQRRRHTRAGSSPVWPSL